MTIINNKIIYVKILELKKKLSTINMNRNNIRCHNKIKINTNILS